MRAHVLVLVLVMLSAQVWLTAAEPVAPGDPVPAGTVTSLAGTADTLAGLRGEGPLVLMVWCSSCHSCRGAEGAFDRFASDYRGTVPIYALASNPHETAAAVQARQEQTRLGFPVVLDPAGAIADACGVTDTTTVLVIAADGTLAYRGPLEQGGRAHAREALREILAGQPVSIREAEQQGCPIR